MATEIRCERCGKLVRVASRQGAKVRCENCGHRLAVPDAVASLPIPGGVVQTACDTTAPPARDAAEAPYESQPALARAMPWVVSLFFHLGVALVMMLVTILIKPVAAKPMTVQAAILPAPLTPRLVPTSYRRPEDRRRSATTPDPLDRYKSPLPPGGIEPRRRQRPVILTPAPGDRRTGGLRRGLGGGFFGVRGPHRPGGWEDGETGGSYYHVVYVIDRSGSMLETFDRVRYEMLRSISHLRVPQDFHVILFASGPPQENAPRRLVPPTPDQKRFVAEWLTGVRPEAQTDPLPALKRAFDVLDACRDDRGKLIYFLTDGVFPDGGKVLELVRRRNADQRVSICTFMYGFRPPEAVALLETIAAENHGRYKYVSPDE